MKTTLLKLVVGIGLLASLPVNVRASEGHSRSGIIGRVTGGAISATPDGEGGSVLPNHVRVYSEKGKVVAEVETQVVGNELWHFEMNLKPETYILVAYAGAGPESGLYSYPLEVRVEKRQFTDVTISFRPL